MNVTSGICDKIDECVVNTQCGAHGECTDHDGHWHCVCETGYSGDGKSCTNINECDNRPCGAGSCSGNGYNFWQNLVTFFLIR